MAVGATTQDYLTLISQYESGNQNIVNYRFGPGYTAQGYYQITNQNWNAVAPLLGIDTSVYPNAMTAPQELQAEVATYLLTQTPAGISNWSNYNPQLAAALSTAGMQTAGPVIDWGAAAPSAPAPAGGPLIDLSGAAATTPTADILSQIDAGSLDLSSLSIDPTLLALLGLGAVALYLVVAD